LELGWLCFIVSDEKKLLLYAQYRHTLWLNLHIAAEWMETARAIRSFGLIHPWTSIFFSFESDLVFYKELVQILGAMNAQSSAKKFLFTSPQANSVLGQPNCTAMVSINDLDTFSFFVVVSPVSSVPISSLSVTEIHVYFSVSDLTVDTSDQASSIVVELSLIQKLL